MRIKLVSLNIERDKHLQRVIPFIQSEKPDILCLQEVCQKDLVHFQKLMGSQYHFSPSGIHTVDGATNVEGEAVFSRLPATQWFAEQYAGPDTLTEHNDEMSTREKNEYVKRTITGCEIQSGTSVFRIATTHFTWTPDGLPDAYQREDVRNMLDATTRMGEMILCGDFNAPRGGEIFAFINTHYHDAIPPQYKTSIDVSLHRMGKERPEQLVDKMVDGLFMTHGYKASGVRLESGVSDHCAVVAKIHITGIRRTFNFWEILRW